MTDEADKESTAEAADSPKDAKKPEAAAKKPTKEEKTKSKVRFLTGALVVVVLIFIYVVFHSFEVMKEVRNPNSQYARPERQVKQPTQAELEADELKFQPKAVVPIPKDSPVMHEQLKVPDKKAVPKAR